MIWFKKLCFEKKPKAEVKQLVGLNDVDSKVTIDTISDKPEPEVEEGHSVEWPMNSVKLKVIFNTFGEPDINFRSGSRSFEVHKKVLEKHSSVIKAKLSHVWQASGDVLQLDEEYVEPEVIEELITWMYLNYAGNRSCSTENAYSLCIAAHYLIIPKLIAYCCLELDRQIAPDNFYDIYTLSKHLDLDILRENCEWAVSNKPTTFFQSPQVVKWSAEELTMFIEKSVKREDSFKVREAILLSLVIWTEGMFDNHFQELDNFFKFVPPEALSSDALFRFMETELYSKLDESLQKQYYVRSYLPAGFSSTDKLYCVRLTDCYDSSSINLHCLDLSANQNWSSLPLERLIYTLGAPGDQNRQKWSTIGPLLGVSCRKNIYFFGHILFGITKHRHLKIFSAETGEWISSELIKPLDGCDKQMLAGAALDDYIYITTGFARSLRPEVDRSVNRYCLENKQWETGVAEMQTARLTHQLISLDGLLYAIGGEVLELGQDPSPERYDPPANRWEYIAPSNYRHELPVAVAHQGQIYVLSQAGFETYSPKTDRWSELPVPDVYRRPSLISIAGRLWLMNDSVRCPDFGFGHQIRLVHEFDVVKQEWTRLPDLPEGDYTNFAFVIKQ